MPSDRLARLKERQKAVTDQQKMLREEIRKEEKKKEAELRKAKQERDAKRNNRIAVVVQKKAEQDSAVKKILREWLIENQEDGDKELFEDFDLPDIASARHKGNGSDAQSDLPTYAKVAQAG